MAEATGGFGFAPPRTERTRSRQRAAAIEMMATVSLTVSLVIAATAVSLGKRSLTRNDQVERASMQTPMGALLDEADGWFALRAAE